MPTSERQIDALLVHDRFVRALARGLVRDRATAEDIAQEAWLAALRSRAVAVATFPRWVSGALRNLAEKARRGERRRAERDEAVAREELVPSAAEVLERESARARVVAAVLALEEPYRSTLLLRYFEGLPPRTIAGHMAAPVETVRTREKRALELLRLRLDREFGSRSAWAALLLPFARLPLVPIAEGASPSTPNQRKPAMKLASKLAGLGLVLTAGVVLLFRSSSPETGRSVLATTALPEEESASGDAVRDGTPIAAPLGHDGRTSIGTTPVALVEPAPPSVAASSTGSLHLVLTWSDGSPAEGVHASVVDVGRSSWDPLTAVTGAAGECTVAGLREGKCWITIDRREYWERADITAGEETMLALQIPRGFDVEGLVADADGAPVAGAAVWLGDVWSSPETPARVTTSGADGSFSIRSLQGSQACSSIWARADGHAPSLVRTLDEPEGTVASVTLALGGAGAGVTGRVLDPTGAPVEGALVLVDGQDMLRAYRETLPDGREAILSHSGPFALRTDADGRFAVDGVRAGDVPLGVVAPGFAAWRGSIAVAAGETADREVTLQAGFRLSGTVRDAAGNPVAGRVFVFSVTLSSQLSPTVMTGSDGTFELEGLAAGEIHVIADGADGDAWTTMTGQAGDELTWDALLGPETPPEPLILESSPWGK